jgi:dynactin 1
MTKYKVGQKVEVTSKEGPREGLVRYVGPIHVSDGTWLGIELTERAGKNDGSIQEERYFTCPDEHGLFTRESSGVRILAEPQPPKAVTRPKPTAPAAKSRPSSVGVSKAAPSRPSSGATPSRGLARQSVSASSPSPASRTTTLRAPARKPSIATTTSSTPPTSESLAPQSSTSSRPSISSTSSQSTLKSARDSNADALKTKIKHLEKQRQDDEETLKELSKVKEERDRFHGIYLKLETKCQSLRQETTELKEKTKTLQTDNDRLVRAEQESEIFLDNATMDQQMAELRAEQAEEDLMEVRKLAEARELELETLRDELKAYQTDMSEEDKKEAGYYRLKAENEKLRDALRFLKDYTDENVADYKAQIAEMEEDVLELDTFKQDNSLLQERLAKGEAIIEHLQQQVDAANEWEDMIGELTTRNQELEDQIAQQYIVVQDLENLRELNDELELQHIETAEELRAEIEAKYLEIAEQQQLIKDQSTTISENEDLISKFRDLVYDLQTRMTDAESSKTFTEAQAKDTAGKFNEVMDLNRRLRAADINATGKDITSELRKLKAEQATEMLEVWLETGSKEFGKTSSMQAYLAAKRITSKSALLHKLLLTAHRHMSHSGSLDESSSRLYCVEAVYHLTTLTTGSERLWSAMSGSSLQDFANFGPAYDDLVAIEKVLDQGLESLKTDKINFSELAGSIGRSTKTQEALLHNFQDILAAFPEDQTISSVRSVTASVTYLDATFSVMNAMMDFLANTTHLDDDAQDVMELFAAPSKACNKSKQAAEKLSKTCDDLRNNALYPELAGHLDPVADQEATLAKIAREAAEWAHNAMKMVAQAFDLDENISEAVNLRELFGYFWANKMWVLDGLVPAITSWQEHASVLKNNIEIQRETAPWIAKAKEVELAKKQEELASVRLQMIANEHQATVLKLHEREKVIETKELEIEHLSAKYREATAKHKVVQTLEEDVAEAHKQVQSLQQLLKKQQAEFEERSARSEQSETTSPENAAPVMTGRGEATEQAMVSTAVPASTVSLVAALEDENRWMRQRKLETKLSEQMKKASSPIRAEYRRIKEDYKMSTATDDATDIIDDAWLDLSTTGEVKKVRDEQPQDETQPTDEQPQETDLTDGQTQDETRKINEQAQEQKRVADEQTRAEKRAKAEWLRGEEKWIMEMIGSYSEPLDDPEWHDMSRAEQFAELERTAERLEKKERERKRKPLAMTPAKPKLKWSSRVFSGETLIEDLEEDDFESFLEMDQSPGVVEFAATMKSCRVAGVVGFREPRKISDRARR